MDIDFNARMQVLDELRMIQEESGKMNEHGLGICARVFLFTIVLFFLQVLMLLGCPLRDLFEVFFCFRWSFVFLAWVIILTVSNNPGRRVRTLNKIYYRESN